MLRKRTDEMTKCFLVILLFVAGCEQTSKGASVSDLQLEGGAPSAVAAAVCATALSKYFHLELGAPRVPLVVEWQEPSDLEGLVVGGAPVVTVDKCNEAKSPCLRIIRKDSLETNRIRVQVRYDVEGVSGYVDVEKRGAGWSAVGARIVEQ